MSTRRERLIDPHAPSARVGKTGRLGVSECEEAIALVACSRRDRLLRVHRHRLSREDLEDSYSQATLELLTRAQGGGAFASHTHIANTLELKFLSRIHDRRRALSGRSPMEAALADALPLAACEHGAVEIADVRAEVEGLALLREDLRRIRSIWPELSTDQRLVLASQLSGESDRREFCRVHGWSFEKYRKVAQRARTRLIRSFLEGNDAGCPASRRTSDQRAGTHL